MGFLTKRIKENFEISNIYRNARKITNFFEEWKKGKRKKGIHGGHKRKCYLTRFKKRVKKMWFDLKIFPPNSTIGEQNLSKLQIIVAIIATQGNNGWKRIIFPNFPIIFNSCKLHRLRHKSRKRCDPDFTDYLSLDNRYATMRHRD